MTNKRFGLKKLIIPDEIDSLPQIREDLFFKMMHQIVKENVDEFTVSFSLTKNTEKNKVWGQLEILTLHATLEYE